MRAPSNKRARGGRAGGRRPNHPNRSFESNGPEVKIRGTAMQVYEKYCTLARDAAGSGNRVSAESYQQHAEHYYRIITAQQQQQARTNGSGQEQQRQPQAQAHPQNRPGGEQPAASQPPHEAPPTDGAPTPATAATGGDASPPVEAAPAEDETRPPRGPRGRRRRGPETAPEPVGGAVETKEDGAAEPSEDGDSIPVAAD